MQKKKHFEGIFSERLNKKSDHHQFYSLHLEKLDDLRIKVSLICNPAGLSLIAVMPYADFDKSKIGAAIAAFSLGTIFGFMSFVAEYALTIRSIGKHDVFPDQIIFAVFTGMTFITFLIGMIGLLVGIDAVFSVIEN